MSALAGGGLAPTFPGAAHHLQARQLGHACGPTPRDRASYVEDDFRTLQSAGVLRLLDGDAEIAPGIHVRRTEGHTHGHQQVELDAQGHTLVYCGDLLPTTAHFAIPWTMAYDLQPLVLMEEKRDLLERAARGGWILFLDHDPAVAAVSVQRTDRGFAMKDVLLRDPV